MELVLPFDFFFRRRLCPPIARLRSSSAALEVLPIWPRRAAFFRSRLFFLTSGALPAPPQGFTRTPASRPCGRSYFPFGFFSFPALLYICSQRRHLLARPSHEALSKAGVPDRFRSFAARLFFSRSFLTYSCPRPLRRGMPLPRLPVDFCPTVRSDTPFERAFPYLFFMPSTPHETYPCFA